MRELRQLSFSLAMRWTEEVVETSSLDWATLKTCLGHLSLRQCQRQHLQGMKMHFKPHLHPFPDTCASLMPRKRLI